MDLEKAFIAHVLANKAMHEATDQHVTEDLFCGPGRDVWRWVTEFYQDHSATPSLEALSRVFPEYAVGAPVEDPLSYVIAELRKRRVHSLVHESMMKAADLLKSKDPYAAVSALKKAVLGSEETIRSSKDVNWIRDAKERIKDYQALKEVKGIDGLATPWETLNDLTQGLHDEELWVIVGKSSVGKTWILLLMAYCFWLQGKVPLVFTKEMSIKQIIRRLDAKHFLLPYMALRSGRLSTFKEEEWRNNIENFAGMADFWISGDDEGPSGVMGINAKIEIFKPDVCLIDGAYFLSDDRKARENWKRLDNIFIDLKKSTARKYDIPVLATMQFSKGAKGKFEDIAQSDIGKHCDGILGVFQSVDEKERREWILRLLKQREGPTGEWRSMADMSTMEFYEIRDHESEEEYEALPF
jgi:replicative DNA helicase